MFAADAEIGALRAAFDDSSMPRSSWTHAAHVTIATTFVLEAEDTVLDRVRAGILRLNDAHGTANTETSGYHETLTVFWITVVRNYCRAHAGMARLELVNALISQFPAQWWKQFYSYDVVAWKEARRKWVAPDLQALK